MMKREFMTPSDWEGKNYYKDLGISVDASAETIKRAHRRLIKELHPDVNLADDRNDYFLGVTEAYSVLNDPFKRDKYDEYFLGLDYRRPGREPKKRKGAFPLLVRLFLFILLLLLLRNLGVIGPMDSLDVATNSASASSSGTTRNSTTSSSRNNQVLALIAGPQGPPGVAGVAGRDGFIGLNGYQGKDGLPGAPGAVGPSGSAGPAGAPGKDGVIGKDGAPGAPGAAGQVGQAGQAGATGPAGPAGPPGPGTGVALSAVPVGDPNCALGGTLFTTQDGTSYYACNGNAGGGGGGGGGGVNGFYVVASVFGITNCDGNGVLMALHSDYSNRDFFLTDLELSDVNGHCNNAVLTAIINVKGTGIKYGIANTYQLADIIQCQKSMSITTSSETNTVTLDDNDCQNKNQTGTRANFKLSDLSARDVSDEDGGLAIQIASR